MNAFREWFYAAVFRPRWQRWAERRTAELVSERGEIYEKMMAELQHIERELARTEKEYDSR